jgi:hypothetical protein
MIVKFMNGRYVDGSEFMGDRDVESLRNWVLS